MTPLKSLEPGAQVVDHPTKRISAPAQARGLRSVKPEMALEAEHRPVTQSLGSMEDCGCITMVARFLIWASRNAR